MYLSMYIRTYIDYIDYTTVYAYMYLSTYADYVHT